MEENNNPLSPFQKAVAFQGITCFICLLIIGIIMIVFGIGVLWTLITTPL